MSNRRSQQRLAIIYNEEIVYSVIQGKEKVKIITKGYASVSVGKIQIKIFWCILVFDTELMHFLTNTSINTREIYSNIRNYMIVLACSYGNDSH